MGKEKKNPGACLTPNLTCLPHVRLSKKSAHSDVLLDPLVLWIPLPGWLLIPRTLFHPSLSEICVQPHTTPRYILTPLRSKGNEQEFPTAITSHFCPPDFIIVPLLLFFACMTIWCPGSFFIRIFLSTACMFLQHTYNMKGSMFPYNINNDTNPCPRHTMSLIPLSYKQHIFGHDLEFVFFHWSIVTSLWAVRIASLGGCLSGWQFFSFQMAKTAFWSGFTFIKKPKSQMLCGTRKIWPAEFDSEILVSK